MANLRYDPEFLKVVLALNAVRPPPPKDVFQLRAGTDAILSLAAGAIPIPPEVTQATFQVTSKDGTSIPLYRFTPPGVDASKPHPVALYLHGGGMVAGSVPIWQSTIAVNAAETGVTIYAVGYRLAPEFPYPTPIDDAYAALEWLRTVGVQENNVDAARIGVVGGSAGGGLAAGLCLRARDEGLTPPIAKQILIYPMIDDRTSIGPEHPLTPFLTWTSRANELGWEAYLSGLKDKTNVPAYAAPARATDLSGLPRTYIDVGGVDLFRDEDFAFAAKLAAANVEVEFHVYPGVPHGFEFGTASLPVTKQAQQNRIAAFRDF